MRFPTQIGKRKYLKFQELGNVITVKTKRKKQELIEIYGEDASKFFERLDNYCATETTHCELDINVIACALLFKGFDFDKTFKIVECLSNIATENLVPINKIWKIHGDLLSPYKSLSSKNAKDINLILSKKQKCP